MLVINMKKKLMLSMLTIIAFSLFIITILFVDVINYENTNNIKERLIKNNEFVISVLKDQNSMKIQDFFYKDINKLGIRVTYINEQGEVLADSEADYKTMDNHNDRAEVIEARSKGIGEIERKSDTLNKKMLYVATRFENGSIIRSSMPIEDIISYQSTYLIYYFEVIFLVLAFSLIAAWRLSIRIVKPINDLKFITSSIERGELNRRVKRDVNDEIGQLGKTFNKMADKLQLTLDEVTDKQNKLSAILKSMDSGVIAVDKNLKVIMINPYAEKIFGIKKDIIGQNLMDNIRNYELENLFKHRSNDYNEIKIHWPKERELRIKIADIINGYEPLGTVAVVQDITDIKRLENVRSQFVANVSHELKTPLTSIKGFSETLREVEDAATREKFLDIIDDEAERLTRLINDILILSSIENAKEINLESINVGDSVKDVYTLMKNTADKKKIELKMVGEDFIEILGDKDKFKQMLINLVDNAIKYSEPGDKVFIIRESKEDKCIISVEDTGVGISKEHIDRLFERFYRVDKARSRSQGGTGLGLAIVKHIVISLNGTINVESEPGKGSKFIITIPKKA